MAVSETSVVVHADASVLAPAVAARLIVKIIDAQAERGWASIVLTGGRVAAAVLRAIRELPAADAVDWPHVDVWWGDERFLPAGDPTATRPRPARHCSTRCRSTRPGCTPCRRPTAPTATTPRRPPSGTPTSWPPRPGPGNAELPHFDVLMLGVGEDGHVASVFPEHPVGYETRPVSAVRGSPKPPPVRTTLTLPAIRTAEEVWLIAAGSDKAAAVGMALSGAGPQQLPAAGAVGVGRTLWLLDRAAAANVPARSRSLR